MKFIVEPQVLNKAPRYCDQLSGYKDCDYDSPGYCGDYNPCPGYSCGGYSTK